MRVVLIVLAALALAGCATLLPTPYGELTEQGGVEVEQIEADVWTVYALGNTATDQTRIDWFIWRRAAELASAEGYAHLEFLAIDDLTTTDQGYQSGYTLYLGEGNSTYIPGTWYTYTTPARRVRIRLLDEASETSFETAALLERYGGELAEDTIIDRLPVLQAFDKPCDPLLPCPPGKAG